MAVRAEGDAPRFLRATAGVMIGVVLLGGLQLARFAAAWVPARPTPQAPGRFAAVLAGADRAAAQRGWPCSATSASCSATAGGASSCTASRAAAGSPWASRSGRPTSAWSFCGAFASGATAWAAGTVFYETGPGSCPTWSSWASPSSSSASRRLCRCRFQPDGPRAPACASPVVGPSATAPVRASSSPGTSGQCCPSSGGVRRLAREQDGQGEGLLPRPLRSRLSAPFPDGAGRTRRRARGVRQSVAHARPQRALGRSHALSRRCHPRRDGLPVRGADALGQGGRLPALRSWHVAAVRAAEPGPVAHWTRAGALVFQYGEQFYNFEGLRRYKDKFRPLWKPRYLAAPGGLVLAAVLADVTTLVERESAASCACEAAGTFLGTPLGIPGRRTTFRVKCLSGESLWVLAAPGTGSSSCWSS